MKACKFGICILLVLLLTPVSASLAEDETPVITGENGVASAAAQVLRLGQPWQAGGTLAPADFTGNGIVDSVDAQAMLAYAAGGLPNRADLPALLEDSLLGEKYFEKFSYSGPVRDGYSYRSENVSVTVTREMTEIGEKRVTYFVADIYLRDLSCFRTAFAHGKYGGIEPVEDMAVDNQAIIAISGDYYGARKRGLVIRNGEVYRDSIIASRDLCVLYDDGVMQTYLAGTVETETILARGAYQSWGFGPALLDADGQPKTEFNTNVGTRNPRSAVGYYEPGHYCFLVVDGRLAGYSYGISMADLSELFHSFGCVAAYNLDGGATAVMANADGMINRQTDSNRECSDILYIADVAGETLPAETPSPDGEADADTGDAEDEAA